jgi:ABC-type uncharacterized transport system YnjBCD ATPase subunit
MLREPQHERKSLQTTSIPRPFEEPKVVLQQPLARTLVACRRNSKAFVFVMPAEAGIQVIEFTISISA